MKTRCSSPFASAPACLLPAKTWAAGTTGRRCAIIDARPNNGFCPGHSFGQYLSGLCARLCRHRRQGDAGEGAPAGAGFAPAIIGAFLGRQPLSRLHLRQDFHRHDRCARVRRRSAGLQGARCRARFGAWRICRPAAFRAPSNTRGRITDESFCWDEPYTLPENPFLAWQRGAGSRYRDLGVRFLADDWYLDPLAAGRECAAGQARVQPRERDEQRHAGLFRAGQREASARGDERLSIFCAPRRVLPPAAGDPMRTFASPAAAKSARA